MINISERNKAICVLYGQDYNLSEIGRLFSLSRERIRLIIKEYGITPKTRSEVITISRSKTLERRISLKVYKSIANCRNCKSVFLKSDPKKIFCSVKCRVAFLYPNSDRSWVEPAIIKAMNGVSLRDAVTSTLPNVSNLASSVTTLHKSMAKRGLVLPPIKVICKCGKEFTKARTIKAARQIFCNACTTRHASKLHFKALDSDHTACGHRAKYTTSEIDRTTCDACKKSKALKGVF